jgi:ATP-dependent 26S proteasome regulatory subunit
MTTNYITRLDEILIQPGRMNKKVELGLVNKKITIDFFYIIFKPIESDIAPPKNAQLDILVREDKKVYKATSS